MTSSERRGAVRIPARLAMEIVIGEDAADVKSLNVSASGVYFTSSKYIEPLTKLRVTLDLPDSDDTTSGSVVACDGVVVRIEPDVQDPAVTEYEVACYFTDVSDPAALETYIVRHVPF